MAVNCLTWLETAGDDSKWLETDRNSWKLLKVKGMTGNVRICLEMSGNYLEMAGTQWFRSQVGPILGLFKCSFFPS